MSDQPAKKQTFSFRFKTLDDEAKFLARVKVLGTSTSILARDLIGLGLDREALSAEPAGPLAEAPPQVPDELKRLVVKAAWAVVVAISPQLDEAAAAEFLRGIFGEFE